MYKWKSSKKAKKEFAQNMQDPIFANDYYKRKEMRADIRRSKSKFEYPSAGGYFVPTKSQNDFCFDYPNSFTTVSEEEARNEILLGYSNNEKINHDYIHIVNEKIRTKINQNENRYL
jgi:hypothetical protein